MRRHLALLLLCWAALLYAGDATMPGERGRVRPPIRLPSQFFNRMTAGGAPAVVDPLYPAGMVAALTTSSAQLVNNQMVMAPFVSSRSGTVMSALAAILQAAPVGQPHPNAGASVGVVCRLTIYDSYASGYPNGQLYPSHLLFTTANQTPGGGLCNGGSLVGSACASDDTVSCPGATCPGCCVTNYACEAGTRVGLTCSTDDTNATTGCPGATCPACCLVKSGFVNNFALGKGAFTGGFPADGTNMAFSVAPERVYWFGIQCGGGSQQPWVKCINALGTWAVAMDSFLSVPWNVIRKTQGGVSSPDPFPVTPLSGALGIQFVQLPCMPLVAAQMGQ